ncbi:hypothetical protein HUG17_7271 [Dermatophagoides farinae]|uniref:RRM domain-containing protein n=1 Tax=Dermatophagoides farinae TaxID=6954 RepID=A0A9D4NP55_DERFA|nr:hypothetical protein HUG17_7271 [Dermatophagoides farinae]
MTIESLATNIDSKLNLNDHISDSTISSSQCPNDDITTIKNESQSSTLSSSSSSAQTSSNTTSNVTANQNNHHHNNTNNVPKFGTPVPNRVFVGGIPDDATDNDVRQLFAQYGNIKLVKIITDRAGISKGYGFVTFERAEDAQKVIKEAENLIIKNRKLNVSTAVMKRQDFPFEPRMMPTTGMLFYPQISTFANPVTASAASGYNHHHQYYSENYPYPLIEGLPFAMPLATMNGHFIPGLPPAGNACAPLLTSPVSAAASQYIAAQQPPPTASTQAYSPVNPYPSTGPSAATHYIYSANPSANSSSIAIAGYGGSQQSTHVLTAAGTGSNAAMNVSPVFPPLPSQTTPYPSNVTATNSTTPNVGNNGLSGYQQLNGITSTSGHPAGNSAPISSSSSQMNVGSNQSQQQQYLAYSNSIPDSMVANSNSPNNNTGMVIMAGGGHPSHHQPSYTTYPSSTNPSSLKMDGLVDMTLVSPSMDTTNSTLVPHPMGSHYASHMPNAHHYMQSQQPPPQPGAHYMHMASIGGIELHHMWSSSATTPTTSSLGHHQNSTTNVPNGQPPPQKLPVAGNFAVVQPQTTTSVMNGQKSNQPLITSTTGHRSQYHGHYANKRSSPPVSQSTSSSNRSSYPATSNNIHYNQSMITKDKMTVHSNRHSNPNSSSSYNHNSHSSSYNNNSSNASHHHHKKMYHNNGHHTWNSNTRIPSNKVLNGHGHNRGHNYHDTMAMTDMAKSSSSYSGGGGHHYPPSNTHKPSSVMFSNNHNRTGNGHYQYPSSAIKTNHVVQSSSSTSSSLQQQPQAYVTKTINGVQIYALANNTNTTSLDAQSQPSPTIIVFFKIHSWSRKWSKF